MIAEPPVRRRGRRLRVRMTTPRLTTLLLVGLLVLSLLPLASRTGWLLAYLVLVLVTCIVLRGARRQPGSWLGRRSVRRVVVCLIALDCVALLAMTGPAANGIVGPFLLLVVLNVALGSATQRMATATDDAVDERQELLRNRAHRIAYVIFAALVAMVLLADIASATTRSWVGASFGGGGFLVYLELLFVLPAMVLAFLDRGYGTQELAELRQQRAHDSRTRWALALVALTAVIPVLLSLAVVVLPVRTSSSSQAAEAGSDNPAATCREFYATAEAGAGVGASLPIHAQVCWDGQRAAESFGMNDSDCMISSSVAASVTRLQCTRTTSAAGTLSFTYRADVAPSMLPFLHRQVTLRLVIDRKGVVEQFP